MRRGDAGAGRHHIAVLQVAAAARPGFLIVGTYPQSGPLATLRATAAKNKSETIKLDGGGLASVAKKPTSVYVAYPGRDLLIEVYDPDPSGARELVTSGRIVRVR